MTLKFFSCPDKLIIGRNLKIWQFNFLIMKIIYIKNWTFDPNFEVTVLYCLQKVISHAKAKGSNFHIIDIWLLITINKIFIVTIVFLVTNLFICVCVM